MDDTLVHYTLTGAADWKMLSTVGGVSFLILQATVIILIGVIYRTLPKHQDLQELRATNNLDIEKLALRFEGVLNRYMDKELEARLKKEDDILAACEKHRTACQARYDRHLEKCFMGKPQ